MRIADANYQGLVNVLGLSPKSDMWADWNNEYYFRYETLNITYHRYPGNEFINFYSEIRKDDILVLVSEQNRYIFDASFVDGNFSKSVKVCIKSNADIFFDLSDSLYQHFKEIICKSGSACTTNNDLKDKLEGVVSIDIVDSISGEKISTEVNIDDLVSVSKKGEDFSYNFGLNSDNLFTDCDIILQNKFFEHYYFLISN